MWCQNKCLVPTAQGLNFLGRKYPVRSTVKWIKVKSTGVKNKQPPKDPNPLCSLHKAAALWSHRRGRRGAGWRDEGSAPRFQLPLQDDTHTVSRFETGTRCWNFRISPQWWGERSAFGDLLNKGLAWRRPTRFVLWPCRGEPGPISRKGREDTSVEYNREHSSIQGFFPNSGVCKWRCPSEGWVDTVFLKQCP